MAICCLLGQPALADTTPAQCKEVRAKFAETSSRWFGLDRAGNLTVLKQDDEVNEATVEKLVFLRSADEGNNQATVVAVKITFQTIGNETDKNWIRLKNKFKNSFSVQFNDYQAFHNGTREIFRIKNNFHLSSGVFNRRIPFTTFNPQERRMLLSYPTPPENTEETFRSYLFPLDGLHPDGTCVDFAPVIPQGTKKLRVEIVDLLDNPETAVFFHDSLGIGLKE